MSYPLSGQGRTGRVIGDALTLDLRAEVKSTARNLWMFLVHEVGQTAIRLWLARLPAVCTPESGFALADADL